MGAGTYAKQGGENVSAEIIIAGLSLLGTLAGYIDYLYYDSAFSDCFVHIPGNIREYD